MPSPRKPKTNPTKKAATPEFDPNTGPSFTRRNAAIAFSICLVLTVLVIFGFLLYKEKQKRAVAADFFGPKQAIPDSQRYENNNWGFTFMYPGSWTQLRGQTQNDEDDKYYFSTDPIAFKNELSDTGAIFEVAVFTNWKHSTFEQWLTDQETSYFNPGEILSKAPESFQGSEAKLYSIKFAHPTDNAAYETILATTKDDNRIYEFILITATKDAQTKYLDNYKAIINSMEFYKGIAN